MSLIASCLTQRRAQGHLLDALVSGEVHCDEQRLLDATSPVAREGREVREVREDAQSEHQ